jgi:hypothetical protein
MEASYFYFIVLPLGIFVFLLSALAYYYARREEQAQRNWNKLMNTYTEEQPEPQEDTRMDAYHAMKFEKALERVNVVNDLDKPGREEEDVIETRSSEEDVSYNVT